MKHITGYDQWKTASPYDDEVGIPDKEWEQLELAIKDLNNGRNLDCWPLCSFGWKDADIDPTGCTGISKIEQYDEETIIVYIGGHKSFGAPSEWWFDNDVIITDDEIEMYDEIAAEIMCDTGYPGDWEGDGWSIYFKDHVTVSIVFDGGIEVDIRATAKLIVDTAVVACNQFHDAMAYFDGLMNDLYKEMSKSR